MSRDPVEDNDVSLEYGNARISESGSRCAKRLLEDVFTGYDMKLQIALGTGEPHANQIGSDGLVFCSWFGDSDKYKDVTEKGTRFVAERADPCDINTGRKALGREILEHLNDWDWLCTNHKRLQKGLETAYGHMTKEAFEQFVRELKKESNGLIYMENGNGFWGSMNPVNPPGKLVVRCYLQRGGLFGDTTLLDSRRQTFGPCYARGPVLDSAKRANKEASD